MKHEKKPTRSQRKFIEDCGETPAEWFVVKDTPERMELVSRDGERVITIAKERKR